MSATPENKPSWFKPSTVLIAEDHTAIRDLLVRHLSASSQYQVIGQVEDGTHVISECERLQPRVLILDVDLPGLDGVVVARALQTRAPETHILVFSGFADHVTVRETMRAGVRGFVEKTAGIEIFDKALAAVSVGHTFFGDRILELAKTKPDEDGEKLSGRQMEVLQMVSQGLTTREISDRLRISLRTAEHHRHRLMSRLGAHNAADLTREAYRLGILQGPRELRHPKPAWDQGAPEENA